MTLAIHIVGWPGRGRPRGPGKPIAKRAGHPTKGLRGKIAQIESEYRSGLTLHQIGEKFGVTREYIRQLLRGRVSSKEGGICARSQMRVARIRSAKNQQCLAKRGMPWSEYRCISGSIKAAYRYQCRSAKYRGIPFLLNFKEWLDIWNASGKWGERGRHKNEYCMARKNDEGPYELGNVYITTCSANGADYQRRRRAGKPNKQRVATGVYLAYPGWPRGAYLARYGRKNIGHFPTAAEAIAARESFLEAA